MTTQKDPTVAITNLTSDHPRLDSTHDPCGFYGLSVLCDVLSCAVAVVAVVVAKSCLIIIFSRCGSLVGLSGLRARSPADKSLLRHCNLLSLNAMSFWLLFACPTSLVVKLVCSWNSREKWAFKPYHIYAYMLSSRNWATYSTPKQRLIDQKT